MKKITFLLLFSILSMNVFAQDPMGVTLDITNKADFQINGETELSFTPGQTVTFDIEYTLGTTNGNPNTLWFLFVRIENAASAAMNQGAEGAAAIYPAAGTESGGVWSTTATYTMEGDMGATLPLTSADPSVGYRLNAYMAYYKEGLTDGPNQVFGGFGGAYQPDVFIRSTLSTNEFSKNTFNIYPNPVNDELFINNNIQFDNFEIRDVMGKLVQSGNFTKSINVSSLTKGMYFIGIDNTFKKFIKK